MPELGKSRRTWIVDVHDEPPFGFCATGQQFGDDAGLGRCVSLHVAVEIQMIPGEVGVRRHVQVTAHGAPLLQGVRADLDDGRTRPGALHLGEQPLQVRSFRCRAGSVTLPATDPHARGPNHPHAHASTL